MGLDVFGLGLFDPFNFGAEFRETLALVCIQFTIPLCDGRPLAYRRNK